MSNELKTTGVIARIFPSQQVSDKMIKQEFIIEIKDGNYPQIVKFETVNKPDLLSKLGEGQEVTVFFNLRGREWQGKYFTNLQAWKIEAEAAAPQIETHKAKLVEANPVADDLPF